MEASVKSICNGQRQKDQILAENLQIYSQAFNIANQRFQELEHALQETFADA
ncbi:hypothetical protein HK405_011629 [Cladochytrium tenue]|nr:hypothetical protein HK405_011629 [Cladochytrium tenue]